MPTTFKGTSPFHAGTYSQNGAAGVNSSAACNAACVADPACVQMTWSPRPSDPCVLYSAIHKQYETIPGAAGWVKCAAGSTDADKCAYVTSGGGPSPPGPGPATPCMFYSAIDTTGAPRPAKGVTQLMLVGRRELVQHDWVAPAAVPSSSAAAGTAAAAALPRVELGATEVTVTMATAFPSANGVTLTVDWNSTAVTAVGMTLNLRIPSWLNQKLTVTVGGKHRQHHPQPRRRQQQLHAASLTTMAGQPGTYLAIDREWSQGDTVSFALPTVFSFSHYTGMNQVAGHEGSRYALQVGPIVLAAVGPAIAAFGHDQTVVIPHQPTVGAAGAAPAWLTPIAGKPLHFAVAGVAGIVFKPNYAMLGNEKFTTFPIFANATA